VILHPLLSTRRVQIGSRQKRIIDMTLELENLYI
jgi:hypothetical protein